MTLTITPEDPTHPDAALLISHLAAELGALYNTDGSGSFTPADVQVPRAAFVVARFDGEPVGCGAIRPFGTDDCGGSAEIKRVFVEPKMRGQGISRRILEKLEALALEFGYHSLVLETGFKQPQAIRLYETSGFYRIPNYGKYAGLTDRLCFAKKIRHP